MEESAIALANGLGLNALSEGRLSGFPEMMLGSVVKVSLLLSHPLRVQLSFLYRAVQQVLSLLPPPQSFEILTVI